MLWHPKGETGKLVRGSTRQHADRDRRKTSACAHAFETGHHHRTSAAEILAYDDQSLTLEMVDSESGVSEQFDKDVNKAYSR